MNKRATLKDIAEATGVHVSTVSRALDPKRETPLTADVVEKVREAAVRLGYRPNRVAYSLRTNRTMTIGVMIPDITNTLFPPIVRGIDSVMEPKGYASILVNTDNQPAREAELLNILRDRGVDGIIHAAASLDDAPIRELVRNGVPVVTVNRRVDGSEIPFVINDDKRGVEAIFAKLIGLGHARIAHIAGPSHLSTGQVRRAVFLTAARDAGLDPERLVICEASYFDEAEGARCAADVLSKAPDTTALLCANDRLALGAIRTLKEMGLSCPTDVSVTGFNDMPLLEMITPGLTTVRVRQFKAGQAAAETLLHVLTGDPTEVPRETVLPVAVVDRESIAAARTSKA